MALLESGKDKTIIHEISNLPISTAWGNVYNAIVNVDISSLGLTEKPKSIVVSFMATSGNAWTAIDYLNTDNTVVCVVLVRPTSANATGKLVIKID